MKVKIHPSLSAAFLLLFISCNNAPKTPNADKSINTNVVLTVGSVNITGYEFEKNLNAFKGGFFQKNGYQPQNADIKNWTNSFIDRTYILADAYAKGYDKDKHIDTLVQSAAHLMIAQPHGILENNTINGKQPGATQIKTAVERSKKKIDIEYLRFNNEQDALTFLDKKQPKTVQEFRTLLTKMTSIPVRYNKEILVWPFNKFWGSEDVIFNLKRDDISPLIKDNNGCYLIHVTNVEYNLQPQENEKFMYAKLQFIHQQKSAAAYKTEIDKRAHIQINENALKQLAEKIKNYVYGPNHTFLKGNFVELPPVKLLTYTTPQLTQKTITVTDLFDYYNALLIKQDMNDISSIKSTLAGMVYSDYAYNKATKMGITKQPKFLLDENNFKNNLIYNLYETNELTDKNPVSEREIINTYNNLKQGFAKATDAIVSIYYFNNKPNATFGSFSLKQNSGDTLKLRGLIKAEKNIKVNYANKSLPDTLKKIIFDEKAGIIARPLQLGNEFAVVKIETATGSRIPEINEVKSQVISEIKTSRLDKNKQVRLSKLKAIYTLKNAIYNK